MSHVIQIQGLHKRYGRHVALRGIDLTVDPGEVYGFIGPNGAGKTTAMRILVDVLRPSSGTVRVLGEDPRRGGARLRSRIGYLPGELRLDGRYDVATLLDHFADLSGPGGPESFDWRPLAERLGLDPTRQVRGLSKGNKQKVGLVQAFLHQPELLILDEPTSGLDPLMQQEFRRLVGEARESGRTIFLSSHVLSEIEHVADRVSVLREGRMVLTSSVSELRARLGVRCSVQLADPVPPSALVGLPGVRSVVASQADPAHLTIELADSPDALVKALAKHTVLDLTAEHPDLEAVVMDLYRDETTDDGTVVSPRHARDSTRPASPRADAPDDQAIGDDPRPPRPGDPAPTRSTAGFHGGKR